MAVVRSGNRYCCLHLATRTFALQIRSQKTPIKTLVLLFGALCLFSWLPLSAWGSVGGSISGTVTDPSGAVVPKATVTATNTDTGIKQSVASDEKGFYSFPSLPVGHYDLEVVST